MRPAVVELDDAFEQQPKLLEAVRGRGGQVVNVRDLGPQVRLWAGRKTMDRLARRLKITLPNDGEPELVFAGSGDFHHLTPLLLERAAARADGPITVLHFDNHPDWVRTANGLHCGSWVRRAARMEGVAAVMTVGVCSDDVGQKKAGQGDLASIRNGRLLIYAWANPDGGRELRFGTHAWPTIEAMGQGAFLEFLDVAVPTQAVYITIDKDVLRRQDALTNWDQGELTLEFLIQVIRRVTRGRQVVGADVVGDWSRPVYRGDPVTRMRKWGEVWLDQPWGRPDPQLVRAVNEPVNLQLLDLFSEIAP